MLSSLGAELARLAAEYGLATGLTRRFDETARLDHVLVLIDEVEEIAGERGSADATAVGVVNELLKAIVRFRGQDGRLLVCLIRPHMADRTDMDRAEAAQDRRARSGPLDTDTDEPAVAPLRTGLPTRHRLVVVPLDEVFVGKGCVKASHYRGG